MTSSPRSLPETTETAEPAPADHAPDPGRQPLPEHYYDLGAVRRHAYALLTRGARDRRSAFHTPVLATASADGIPQARTVVLRGFDVEARMLSVHTDVRSDKVTEIETNAGVALLFYDPAQKIQIRVAGTAGVHTNDPVAKAAWSKLQAFSRRCYLAAPPGRDSAEPTSGLVAELERRAPTLTESEAGFAHFAVIRTTIRRLDWLYLAALGHRRAAITWDESGQAEATWLTP